MPTRKEIQLAVNRLQSAEVDRLREGWQTLPAWGKSVGVNRQRAHALLPRIPENCKRIKPTGWEILEGTPKPAAMKGGRKKKP